MIVNAPRTTLADAIARAKAIAPGRATVPILSHCRLTARGHTLTVEATDLDRHIAVAVEVEVIAEGTACLPVVRLAEALKRAPEEGPVRLETMADTGRVKMTAGRARWTFAGLQPDDFPTLGFGAIDIAFEVDADTLAGMLTRASAAASTEEVRYYLNGVCLLEGPDGNLCAVATDGHRLILVEAEMPEGGGGLTARIVPSASIAGILATAAGTTEIEFDDALRMRVRAGGATLTTKLVDGTYPDYRRVMPAAGGGTVCVTTVAALRAAALRTRLIADVPEKSKTRAVALSVEGKRIVVHAHGSTGDAYDEADAAFEGAPCVIGLDGTYLVEMLDQLPATGSVEIEISDPGSPLRITSADAPDITMVLMPRRLPGDGGDAGGEEANDE